MNTKHTPGPWAWQKFGTKYCLTAQHGMREIILSANIDEEMSLQPYLSMNDDGILQPIDPTHPNAKMIAAAPEMIDMLQKAHKSLVEWGIELAIVDKIEEVIKKATE